MKKHELWQAYVDKNPAFAGMDPITLSAAGLKKLFETTYTQGFKECVTKGESLANVKRPEYVNAPRGPSEYYDLIHL